MFGSVAAFSQACVAIAINNLKSVSVNSCCNRMFQSKIQKVCNPDCDQFWLWWLPTASVPTSVLHKVATEARLHQTDNESIGIDMNPNYHEFKINKVGIIARSIVRSMFSVFLTIGACRQLYSLQILPRQSLDTFDRWTIRTFLPTAFAWHADAHWLRYRIRNVSHSGRGEVLEHCFRATKHCGNICEYIIYYV